MMLAPGLTYRLGEFRDSRVHVLAADLSRVAVRPVLDCQVFPFKMCRPVPVAIEQGALASVGGGYNATLFAGLGVSDQPLHALVLDREIITTGVGAGGYGLLIGDDFATTRQNHIEVVIWSAGISHRVEHVNRGHDGDLVAFTPRGGTNEYPRRNKHYALLGDPGKWIEHGDVQKRVWHVMRSQSLVPFKVWPNSIVLESTTPLELGTVVTWTQRLGAPGIRHIVSGATGLVSEGENRITFSMLHPEASHGPDSWYVRKNPRMCLGTSQDGRTVYLVTVEGRIPSSKGLRLKELAELLIRRLGVWGATNLDGGGSAFCWTRAGGLVADSCYGDGTLSGLRPDHYATAVFPR